MTVLQNIRGVIRTITRVLCLYRYGLAHPHDAFDHRRSARPGDLNKPIPGTLELSSYMLPCFILLGVAYTQQVKGHVRVEMLVRRLPERVGYLFDILTTSLSLFIVIVLAWQGWILGVEEKAVSDMLRIPQWPFKLLVFVAATSLALELFIDLFESAGKFVRR